jgi:hypothetical protein
MQIVDLPPATYNARREEIETWIGHHCNSSVKLFLLTHNKALPDSLRVKLADDGPGDVEIPLATFAKFMMTPDKALGPLGDMLVQLEQIPDFMNSAFQLRYRFDDANEAMRFKLTF